MQALSYRITPELQLVQLVSVPSQVTQEPPHSQISLTVFLTVPSGQLLTHLVELADSRKYPALQSTQSVAFAVQPSQPALQVLQVPVAVSS